MTLFPVACYNPRTPSLPPPEPPTPLDTVSYSPASYADGCNRMAPVNLHQSYEHVTIQAVGVGAVILLQNHYRVLHLAVNEVDPEVSMCRPPPLAVTHWATDVTGHSRSREGDHI